MSILLGLDVGTTNTKAIALDSESNQPVRVATRPTPYVDIPLPSESRKAREIEPEALWQTVVDAVREITATAGPIQGVGIASMAESGVPLDRHGRPLDRIIPWNDPRSEPQLRAVVDQFGAEYLFQVTGQAQRFVYTLLKLLWLRQHRPAVLQSLQRWLSVADYVAFRLTGAAATDLSLASRTMLFDQRRGDWSPELLALAGIRPDQLPVAAPAGTTIGRVNGRAAAETGLPAGIAVAIGGHDHLCGALAAGATRPGVAIDSIGTAESIVVPISAFSDDLRFAHGRICCYAHVVPGHYAVQAGIANGGGGLEWIARQLFSETIDPVGTALAAAAAVPPGAEGVLFFPYLGGNGAPVGDENLSASFLGLRPGHQRGHFVRAVLEGIAFGMRHAYEVVSAVVGPPDSPLTIFGGGSRSPLWLQIRANIFGQAVQAVEITEAVALGAALLGGVAAGEFADAIVAAQSIERKATLYLPEPALQARYDTIYRRGYRGIYPAMAPLLAELAALSANAT